MVGDPVDGNPAYAAGGQDPEILREHPHSHEEEAKPSKQSSERLKHLLKTE